MNNLYIIQTRFIPMRKALKIVLSIFAILIIIAAIFGALFFLDLAAYTATGSQTLQPAGTSVGKALVVYDPGLSANSKNVADKVAADLQAQNYTVTLAGIKSSAATNTTGYKVIIVGGPVYAGALTSSVKDEVNGFPWFNGTRVGIFGSGQGATSQDDVNQLRQSIGDPLKTNPGLTDTVIVKIGEKEDLTARAQAFVNQLIP